MKGWWEEESEREREGGGNSVECVSGHIQGRLNRGIHVYDMVGSDQVQGYKDERRTTRRW